MKVKIPEKSVVAGAKGKQAPLSEPNLVFTVVGWRSLASSAQGSRAVLAYYHMVAVL